MNQKKVKAIRKYIRAQGVQAAELVRKTTAMRKQSTIPGVPDLFYVLPLTAYYPKGSYRPFVKIAKKALRSVQMSIIKSGTSAISASMASPA